MWCKHTNYEEAAHIPLIVVAPGVTAPNSRSAAMIETVDIYPTLAALAGLPAPPGVDGRSFVPALQDAALGHRNYVFHVYPRGERLGRAVRTNQFRLVEWKVPGAPADSAALELYDYIADPLETKNIAADKPEIAARLRAILTSQPEAIPQIKQKGKPDRAVLFETKDVNHDGKLTREEFLANQPDPAAAPARFVKFDADKDGVLTREEFISMGAPAAAAKPRP
jgi:iduronate 2-sulfatase